MEGTFRLLLVVKKLMRFGEVTVEATRAAVPDVVVDDDVFGWRREVYGPNAWPLLDDDDWRHAAVDGAWYALKRLPEAMRPLRVVIVAIRVMPADTVADDVRFAAAHAVWRAVDHEPATTPYFEDGRIVFP